MASRQNLQKRRLKARRGRRTKKKAETAGLSGLEGQEGSQVEIDLFFSGWGAEAGTLEMEHDLGLSFSMLGVGVAEMKGA